MNKETLRAVVVIPIALAILLLGLLAALCPLWAVIIGFIAVNKL